MENKNHKKRRYFLALSLMAGAGAIAGKTIGETLKEEAQMVRLITADGQLVEVDANHLPSNQIKKPISNADLQNWLDEERTKKG